MTDLADTWLDFDDADDCTDLWHLDQGPAADEDVCPLCSEGEVVDTHVEWPDDVIVPAPAVVTNDRTETSP